MGNSSPGVCHTSTKLLNCGSLRFPAVVGSLRIGRRTSSSVGPSCRVENWKQPLISSIVQYNTVDGRNPANHLGCLKPCKQWDKLPTSTGVSRISAINSISLLACNHHKPSEVPQSLSFVLRNSSASTFQIHPPQGQKNMFPLFPKCSRKKKWVSSRAIGKFITSTWSKLEVSSTT